MIGTRKLEKVFELLLKSKNRKKGYKDFPSGVRRIISQVNSHFLLMTDVISQ